LEVHLEVTKLNSCIKNNLKINLLSIGAIAGLFAASYPECVQYLGLLSPAVKTPLLTKTCEKLINGKYNLLIPTTGEEFAYMMK